jgi:hypothetical protein
MKHDALVDGGTMFESIMPGRQRELTDERTGRAVLRSRRGALPTGRFMAALSVGLWLVIAAISTQSRAHAAPRLRVHGAASIDARSTYTDGSLRIEGTLRDDARAPLEDQSVSVSLSTVAPSIEGVPLEACPPTKASDSATRISATGTDEGGRFCVVAKMATPRRCVAHFAWLGTPLVDGAKLDLAIDASLASIELRFDPEPAVVSAEAKPFRLDAVASFTDKAAASSPPGLVLVLTNELGTELGRGTTDASGRVRFALVPARMGPPGKGELRATFAGNTTTAGAVHVAPMERHARVELSVPTADGNALPPATPDEGVTVIVLARTASGEPVASGAVEARVEGSPVGAASIENGRARLVLTFSAEEKTISEIRIRYDAGAPGYDSGDEVILRLPVVGTSPWRSVPLVVAGLAVAAWLALGRAAHRPSLRRPVQRPASTSTQARMTVVRAIHDAGTRWTGLVIDAHDATPIRGATVEIVRPGVERSERLAHTSTDDMGRFELPCDTRREGDRLDVSSRLHSPLRQRAPAYGELEVALVLRRRALLDRLVAWAKDRGAPFNAAPEPTPGQVARAGAFDPRIEQWARRVERAAYGPEDVDARVEGDADEGAPPLSPGSAEPREKDVDDTPR